MLPLFLFSGKSSILNVYKWLCKHLVRGHIVIWFVICQEKKCGHSKYIQPSRAIKYLHYLTFTETDSKFRQDRTNVPAPDAGQTSQEKTNLGIYTSSSFIIIAGIIPSCQRGLSLGGNKILPIPQCKESDKSDKCFPVIGCPLLTIYASKLVHV